MLACPTYETCTSCCSVQKNGTAVVATALAQHVARRRLPWRCATTQCSTRMRFAGERIGPARDVAGRPDAGALVCSHSVDG
jgi:hypothetical protein